MSNPATIPGLADGRLEDLHALAVYLSGQLAAHRRPGVTSELAVEASAWKVTEEVGELAGAHSRWRGTSRRAGPYQDVAAEAVDVLLSVAVYAVQAGTGADCLDLRPPGPGLADGAFLPAADHELHVLARAAGLLAGAHADAGSDPSGGLRAWAAGEVLARLCDYADQAGIDLRAAAAAKAQVIVTRGFRDDAVGGAR